MSGLVGVLNAVKGLSGRLLYIPGAPGRGIVSIIRTSGDGSPGTTDIYTITYTNETTDEITVYNGADGQTAYEAAQAGGYTDTQASFYADLAAVAGLAAELALL